MAHPVDPGSHEHSKKPHGGGSSGQHGPSKSAASGSGQPVFAQPTPSPDPSGFKNPVTDQKDRDVAGVQPVPQPVGSAVEPILTLAYHLWQRRCEHQSDDSTIGSDRLP